MLLPPPHYRVALWGGGGRGTPPPIFGVGSSKKWFSEGFERVVRLCDVYALPCVCTASPTMHSARCARRGGQPPHPPKITRLLHCYRPPCACTALCMYRLVCAPPVLLCIRLAALDAGASPRTPLK